MVAMSSASDPTKAPYNGRDCGPSLSDSGPRSERVAGMDDAPVPPFAWSA